MKNSTKFKGYSTDLKLAWISEDLGPDWIQWQQYSSEWIILEITNISVKLRAIRRFLKYLKSKAPYSFDVASMFKGHGNGHFVNSEELKTYLSEAGVTGSRLSSYISVVVSLCDWILKTHLSIDNIDGSNIALFNNPFVKVRYRNSHSESVHSPLPYKYIRQLRQILCSYPKQDLGSKTPWFGLNFRDWHWTFNNLHCFHSGWFEVSPDLLDPEDPDCISRMRLVRRKGELQNIHEIWSPVVAVFLFTKLHLPLRSFQVRFLDSGEGDTWRYERGQWIENTKHLFKYGSLKRPYEKGVFRRVYDSMTEQYTTALYVSTNKTADQNKDEVDRGYTIPWQHDELLYWLEKLRNWQEKYNPINRLTPATELKLKHFGELKSEVKMKEMGEFAFLFRQFNSNFPIDCFSFSNPWYRLLSKLEEDVFNSGLKLANEVRLRFVRDYEKENTKSGKTKTVTNFPLHSLRVSLITCYSMETDLPLPVIAKLLAGHTRLLMTLYYNKISPSLMQQKMKEAHDVLNDKNELSLNNFLADAETSQINLRAVYKLDSGSSIDSVLANSNPICWVEKPTGLCLVGGNPVPGNTSSVGGCWNGGPLIKDATPTSKSVFGPVPNGPYNCVQCRWHITDASYLPGLNARFNLLSYKAHQSSELAVELEGKLDTLKDDLYISEQEGNPFLKHEELQIYERRYEKQRAEADGYAKDYIATFNLIHRIIQLEEQRDSEDYGQKLIAVGSASDLKISMRFTETESELLHLGLLCEDAEIHPDLYDDLRKTPVIAKRTNELSRMMSQAGYKPIFLAMDERTQFIAGNAFMRKMAMLTNSSNKLEGFRLAANYIEAQKYLIDSKLLDSSIEEVIRIEQSVISSDSIKNISQVSRE